MKRLLLVCALACSAGGGGDEARCTFEGSYQLYYELKSGTPGCQQGAISEVLLTSSDEAACTTSCELSGHNPCPSTFTCVPGQPTMECAGETKELPMLDLKLHCTYSLTLEREDD